MSDPQLAHDEYSIRLMLQRGEITKEFSEELLKEARVRYENRQEAKQFRNPEY